jgi:hypothetical protein
MMDFAQCMACGKGFRRRPQIPNQRFCSNALCQRERRRLTQQILRQNDPDYKDNQSRAQQAWTKRNPNYWRDYRRTHPKYLERNRQLQRKRNHERKLSRIAKMDASPSKAPVPSGLYRLIPIEVPGIAKMDAWTVEITVLSRNPEALPDNCKERT